MNEIYFVTGNHLKFNRIKKWLDELAPEIKLTQIDVDIPEIQSLDMEAVALEKAKAAYRLLKKPVLIDDSGIFLNQYNNFPGTLSKFVYEGVGLEGFWLLAKNDPRAYFKTCLVYADSEDNCKMFSAQCEGTIIEPQKNLPKSQMPYLYVFRAAGTDKRYDEIHNSEEAIKYDHRYKAMKSFIEWTKSK